MRELWRRLRYLMNRQRMDEELRGDMEFHQEMAAWQGKGNFGNTLRLREESREAWGWMWIDGLGQDLRYAVRMLKKSPGFTLMAVLILAIGIGVNVAAFSFFNLIVLSPLPVRDPFTLQRFHRRSPLAYAFALPYPEMAYFREHSRTLAAVLALNTTRIPMEGEPKPLTGHFVTTNFFSELGAPMLAGRFFDWAGKDEGPVVVLAEACWRRRFGADLSVVGRVFPVGGKAVTVIGVASKRFSGLSMEQPDFWAPLNQQPYLASGSKLLTDYAADSSGVAMFGRLRAALSPKIAEDELRVLAADLRKAHPAEMGADTWDKETLPAEPVGYAKSLLIGNRRGSGREDQSDLYPLAGMIVSLCLLILAGWRAEIWAACCRRAVRRGNVRCRSAFPWEPATQVARQKHRSTRVRHVLVATQVAAGCVLLIVAGLLVRALEHATSMDPAFEYQRMVAIDPGLATHGYTAEKARSYLETLQTRLRAAPGVEAVALTDTAPLGNRVSAASVQVDGVATEILLNHVDPNFLRTMRIPLLLGHGLQAGDAHSIVIGQTMAARLWPGKNAPGKRFFVDGEDVEVVGIAGSARLVRPEDGGMTELYSPAKRADLPGMIVVVRTAGSAAELPRAAVSIATAINPAVFPAVDLLKSSFVWKLETAQRGVLAVSLPGLAAQLLACLGIVGVVADAVSQRGREIGIRMALGAKPGQVLKVVLRQFVWPVVVGPAVSQLLRKVLYGISNPDPAAYAGAIVVFVVTVGLAAWLPARRALRVDPMRVLRQD